MTQVPTHLIKSQERFNVEQHLARFADHPATFVSLLVPLLVVLCKDFVIAHDLTFYMVDLHKF